MKKKKDIVERILDYIGNTANKAAEKNAKDEARKQILKENPEMAKKLEDFEKQKNKRSDIVKEIMPDMTEKEWEKFTKKTLGW